MSTVMASRSCVPKNSFLVFQPGILTNPLSANKWKIPITGAYQAVCCASIFLRCDVGNIRKDNTERNGKHPRQRCDCEVPPETNAQPFNLSVSAM